MEHETIQLIVHRMDATELYLQSVEKAKNKNWNKEEYLINEGNHRLKKAQKVREIIFENENYKELEQFEISYNIISYNITICEKCGKNKRTLHRVY